MVNPYNEAFWEMNERHARAAAQPIVAGVHQWVETPTVVDVGCGQGIIAEEFRIHGAEVVGIDNGWVPLDRMRLPLENFRQMDIETEDFPITGRWALGMSLEVVEHLTPYGGDKVVKFLAENCRFVLFSAAMPGQGGYGHINEQWPSYWIEKFRVCGMEPDGRIRAHLWADQRVPCYYRQNLLLFYRLGSLMETESGYFTLDVVHPQLYKDKMRIA